MAGASLEPCPSAVEPVPESSLPASVDEETRDAIRVRTEYGLRRDLAWVLLVAEDPTAVMDFGAPMLPSETASLFARSELAGPVQSVLARYGHMEEFGGLYIDNAQGGVIVVLWTGDPAIHEAAIRPELPPCHPVHFRQVQWSEQELRRWQSRISADVDWLAEIPAAAQAVGVDIESNVVAVSVSSAEPDAPERILTHYDAPPGMIRVQVPANGEVEVEIRLPKGFDPGATP